VDTIVDKIEINTRQNRWANEFRG